MKSFYIDHNSTTPLVEPAMLEWGRVQAKFFGNASSVHAAGAEARECLEGARSEIAAMIGANPKEVYFTSGGTEANNWALLGPLDFAVVLGLVVSGIEHKSVLKTMDSNVWKQTLYTLKTTVDGVVDLDNVEWISREFRDKIHENFVASIMLANNETGVIQPVKDVVECIKKIRPKALVHTDAVQAFGKIPVHVKDLGVDLMTISAHKIGGPKGIGALYVKEGTGISPLIRGGHQEREFRAGTEDVAGAAAFAAAAKYRKANLEVYTRNLWKHTRDLEVALFSALDDIWVNGGENERIPNTLNIGFKGVDSEALVILLSEAGVLVSNGSACEAGRLGGSHVLKAMGQTEAQSRAAIRFSFGDDLGDNAVSMIAERVIECVDACRTMQDVPF